MGIVLLVRTEENNLKIILEDDAYPRRSVWYLLWFRTDDFNEGIVFIYVLAITVLN